MFWTKENRPTTLLIVSLIIAVGVAVWISMNQPPPLTPEEQARIDSLATVILNSAQPMALLEEADGTIVIITSINAARKRICYWHPRSADRKMVFESSIHELAQSMTHLSNPNDPDRAKATERFIYQFVKSGQ